jgi:hypothetical protein
MRLPWVRRHESMRDYRKICQRRTLLSGGQLWRYDGRTLKIYLLQEGKYTESDTSQNFPDFPIVDVIPEYVDRANTQGRSPTIREFRAWAKEQLQIKDS